MAVEKATQNGSLTKHAYFAAILAMELIASQKFLINIKHVVIEEMLYMRLKFDKQ